MPVAKGVIKIHQSDDFSKKTPSLSLKAFITSLTFFVLNLFHFSGGKSGDFTLFDGNDYIKVGTVGKSNIVGFIV
jgi:hypothetical protein